KTRGYSGSPESTLNWGVSGPTQVRSTPATPFGQRDEDSWERIYAAAGQIAMLKMKMKMRMHQQPNDDVLAHQILHGAPPPMGPTIPHHHYNDHEELVMQLRFRRTVSGAGNFNGGGCGFNQPLGFRQSAWPVENQRRQVTANGFVPKHVSGCYGGGPHVVKKECAGTGVFLPRRYCLEAPEEYIVQEDQNRTLWIPPSPHTHNNNTSMVFLAHNILLNQTSMLSVLSFLWLEGTWSC
nr:hypothetical protein [Tanacetum cinerariifolium]